MHITVKTKNLDLTPALQEWVDEKIGSLDVLLGKYENQGAVLCEVEVSRTTMHHNKGEVFHAEVNLHLPNKLLRAGVEHADIRTALDIVRDMLHRDIEKYKEKSGHTGSAAKRLAHASRKALSKIMWWRTGK